MTSTDPSEFVDGKHWADILGCDARAQLGEIKRAAERRTREAMTDLYGQRLSERLLEIGNALAAATGERPKRRSRGGIEK